MITQIHSVLLTINRMTQMHVHPPCMLHTCCVFNWKSFTVLTWLFQLALYMYMYIHCNMFFKIHRVCMHIPQAMKSGVTVRPTKFLSLVCPRYVLRHTPWAVSHSFSSLSVELHTHSTHTYTREWMGTAVLKCMKCWNVWMNGPAEQVCVLGETYADTSSWRPMKLT